MRSTRIKPLYRPYFQGNSPEGILRLSSDSEISGGAKKKGIA